MGFRTVSVDIYLVNFLLLNIKLLSFRTVSVDIYQPTIIQG
ncbi:Uncharacterised protein [Megamonas hypermegale]|uniref:Uncharacterized protein n=1 Tax=Megamonas hypermegale TaxID=158847 RepID=A0A378NRA0_9FIRM|nr:Uncharacterised protein [Megamonas hypermegale]